MKSPKDTGQQHPDILDPAGEDPRETEPRFSWTDLEKSFTWSVTGNLNLAHEAVDRWALDRDKRDRAALIFERDGETVSFTFLELREAASRWANLLIDLGVLSGDRVVLYLPACPEVAFVMVACMRLGAIVVPLSTRLGHRDLRPRMSAVRPRAIVTHPSLVEVLPRGGTMDAAQIVLTEAPLPGVFPKEICATDALNQFPRKAPMQWLRGTSPLCMFSVSAARGAPKTVVHGHNLMAAVLATSRQVLNLEEKSIYFCDADHATLRGSIYALFAPWLCGACAVMQGDPFSSSTWYRTLERNKVTTWFTSPHTIAGLMQSGEDLASRYALSKLTHIVSTGGHLSAEMVAWTAAHLKRPARNAWMMTETGMVCVADLSSTDQKPGALGIAPPGIEALVLDKDGKPVPAMTEGELALRVGWPGMLSTLWEDAARFQGYFRFRDVFVTGDVVYRDNDGYLHFVGRTDDILKFDGLSVGAYDVELAMMRHPAVREVGAIVVESEDGPGSFSLWIKVADGFDGSSMLRHDLRHFAAAVLTRSVPIGKIEFVEALPKTPSGEIVYRILRAWHHGLDGGDPSRLTE